MSNLEIRDIAFFRMFIQSVGWFEGKGSELPFIEKKKFRALSDLNGDKAPGPKGFLLAFSQFCWDFEKTNLHFFSGNYKTMRDL